VRSARTSSRSSSCVCPVRFRPSELPDCGYFALVLGAVARAEEHHEGASPGLHVVQAARPNPTANPGSPWRRELRAKLASLGKPTSLRTFVIPCPRCSKWHHSPPSREMVPCPCGSNSPAS
jgi:hypothetical protein